VKSTYQYVHVALCTSCSKNTPVADFRRLEKNRFFAELSIEPDKWPTLVLKELRRPIGIVQSERLDREKFGDKKFTKCFIPIMTIFRDLPTYLTYLRNFFYLTFLLSKAFLILGDFGAFLLFSKSISVHTLLGSR
jgi:hypothetical protein